eukprot:scaffold7671_cov132-Skeletonema_marinoi.AAC.10
MAMVKVLDDDCHGLKFAAMMVCVYGRRGIGSPLATPEHKPILISIIEKQRASPMCICRSGGED